MKTYTVKIIDIGDIKWYLNGKLHRTEGPAIECTNGTKAWYLNGKRHREDGPAVEYANGDKEWFLNGERHRADGPAIEYASGTKAWFLNGENYTEAEFNKLMGKKEVTPVVKVVEIDGVKYELKRID
jgi:hypothetical protein